MPSKKVSTKQGLIPRIKSMFFGVPSDPSTWSGGSSFLRLGTKDSTDVDIIAESSYSYQDIAQIWAAAHANARAVSMQPWRMVTNDSKDKKIEIDDKVYFKALRRPGRNRTSKQFKYALQLWIELAGIAAFYVHKGTNGLPITKNPLQILDPLSLVPNYDDKLNPDIITSYNYFGATLEIENTVVIRVQAIDGFNSSPLRPLATDSYLARQAGKFQGDFYKNGAFPGVYLKYADGDLPEEKDAIQAARDAFLDKFGPGNRFGVAIGNADLQTIESDVNKFDFTGIYKRIDDSSQAVFGVPKVILGTSMGQNRATVTMEEYCYQKYILKYKLDALDDALNDQYLPDEYYDTLWLEHTDIVKDDIGTMAVQLKQAAGMFITPNEARKLIGLEEIEGEECNKIHFQDGNTQQKQIKLMQLELEKLTKAVNTDYGITG